MITRILITKQALSGFRKLACRNFPLEAMQTLWGKIEGSTAVVTSVKNVPHTASEEIINYENSDVVGPAGTTKEHYLGTIHSHPNLQDPSPSEHDWQDAFNHGEHIFGVMAVWKKANGKFATAYCFKEPRPEIVVIHPKIRQIRKLPTSSPPTPEEGTTRVEIACGEVLSSLDPS